MTLTTIKGLTLLGNIQTVLDTLGTLSIALQGVCIDTENSDELISKLGTLAQARGDDSYRAIASGFESGNLIARISDRYSITISDHGDYYFCLATEHKDYEATDSFINYIERGEHV